MVRVDLKGIHRVRKKLSSGAIAEYHYAWRGGPKIWATGSPIAVGSPEYVSAFQMAGKSPLERTVKTFRQMVIAYQQSNEFGRLRPRTKKDYREWLDRIDAKFGDAPIDTFNQPEIRPIAVTWRDQWSGRMAEYGWTVLKRVVSWGYDSGHLKYHHLRGGMSGRKKSRADIFWTSADLVAFHQVAPDYVTRALNAAVETGLRPGDLVRLSRAHIEETDYGRRILIRTSKKGRLASIPITDVMAGIIDRTPKTEMLVLRNSRNMQWTVRGLSKTVKKYARQAGLSEDLVFYDARGTAATRLLLAKVPLSEIAVMMGWSVKTAASMIETYAALDPSITDTVLIHLARSKK